MSQIGHCKLYTMKNILILYLIMHTGIYLTHWEYAPIIGGWMIIFSGTTLFYYLMGKAVNRWYKPIIEE